MDTVRIQEGEAKRKDRLVAAFVAGFEEETREIRGYGLLDFERKQIEREATELYASDNRG